jgi:ribosome-associated heat shock protein Hsp15
MARSTGLRNAVRVADSADVPSSENENPPAQADRIDKWLWAVRVFKTRGLAADACRSGWVRVNEHAVKPAREVRAGESVTVRQGLVTRTLRVVAIPHSRVGAKLVPEYCEELTLPEEFEQAREHRVQQVLTRAPGAGRPTKRDRRALDRFLGRE